MKNETKHRGRPRRANIAASVRRTVALTTSEDAAVKSAAAAAGLPLADYIRRQIVSVN